MDIAEAKTGFQDWELLPDSDSGESFKQIDSAALIQPDYFSLDAQNQYGEGLDDDKSADSDNPSWIDPGSEENPVRFLSKDSGESWSDSGSEQSEYRKTGELDEKEVRFEGIAEISEEKTDDLGKFCLESGGMEISSAKHGGLPEKADCHIESEVLGEEKNENENGGKVIDDPKTGELKKRSVVWWKMPVEFLKYFMFKMSPVWAVSVAAAMMGFAVLGRRLYKMKKKTRGLEIKVVVDDKKVSQVMSRAARLNEAFSIVRRVPVIRPTVGSTNTWPITSLR